MPRGRPLSPLVLNSSERDDLQRWVSRRKTAQALAQRVRLILACARCYADNSNPVGELKSDRLAVARGGNSALGSRLGESFRPIKG